MKVNPLKPFVLGGMAALLMAQPILSQAFVATLPSKIVNVKYPKEFQALLDEVTVCVLEAEAELYTEKTLKSLPSINHGEKRSCREILETKEFAHNLNFEVDYSKPFGEEGNPVIPTTEQEVLTILSKPLESNENFKNTETLEIAMRLFVELNANFEPEVMALHQEGDLLDMLYLRIYNLAYELPKAQGHPLFSEFMKDIRDSYLRVRGSLFFRALVYYAYENNPDKELYETLARYWIHLEQAANGDVYFKPDENHPLYTDVPDTTPTPPNPDDIGFEDLDHAWKEETNEFWAQENTANAGVSVGTSAPVINREVKTDYAVKQDQCLKTIKTYENGRLISKTTETAAKSEYHRCGLGTLDTAASEQETSRDLFVYYRFGGEDQEWEATKTKLSGDLEEYLTYSQLSSLLTDIAMTHGLGAYKDLNRHLFILDGKPLILEKYSDEKLFIDINQWLKDSNIPLEFGRSPEKTEKPAIGLKDL